MNDSPVPTPGSNTDPAAHLSKRARREQELNDLWKTNYGQRKVLNLVWAIRGSATPLQAGESVFKLILDHEFGPLSA